MKCRFLLLSAVLLGAASLGAMQTPPSAEEQEAKAMQEALAKLQEAQRKMNEADRWSRQRWVPRLETMGAWVNGYSDFTAAFCSVAQRVVDYPAGSKNEPPSMEELDWMAGEFLTLEKVNGQLGGLLQSYANEGEVCNEQMLQKAQGWLQEFRGTLDGFKVLLAKTLQAFAAEDSKTEVTRLVNDIKVYFEVFNVQWRAREIELNQYREELKAYWVSEAEKSVN